MTSGNKGGRKEEGKMGRRRGSRPLRSKMKKLLKKEKEGNSFEAPLMWTLRKKASGVWNFAR